MADWNSEGGGGNERESYSGVTEMEERTGVTEYSGVTGGQIEELAEDAGHPADFGLGSSVRQYLYLWAL